MKTQLEIENENLQIMITKGVNELQSAKETGTVSDLKLSGAIVPYYVGELAKSLNLYSQQVLMGKAKIKALPAKMLTVLDELVVAHYTVKTVIDSVGSKKVSIVSLATRLSNYLETEYKIQLLDKKDSEAKTGFVKYIQGSNYKNDRQFKVTNSLLAKYHGDISKNKLSFYKLAAKAIVLLSEMQPIVKNQIAPPLCYISEKRGIETRVDVAKWFKDWLSSMITENDGIILPEYHTPLIEPPIEWEGFRGGGFHSPRFKYDLIKSEVDRENFKEVPKQTLKAVNRLQNTQWRVNKKVLEVMLAASENDLDWGELPTTYEAKKYLSECPHSDTDKSFLTEEQKEDRKMWRKMSAPHYAEQESRHSKVLACKRVLIEANRFKEFEAIYFSYFCDFRGRIYPKASNLQPQGTDYVKALLEFSEGKSIETYEAEKYFYMQGANSFGHGLDKKTLHEKWEWVKDNTQAIKSCADNPYDLKGLWHQSDEDPWLFLAFCFEFKEYISHDKFVSHLPIAFDGSCNGLQHLSAILLDEVGGASVNLTNQISKRDIYTDVKDKAIKLLELDPEPLAKQLLEFGITRKACKRPVMIVPYAGTQRACRRYIQEQIIKEGATEFFKDNLQEAISLYTSVVWESINLTIVKGREVMSFLKDIAKDILVTYGGNTITWVTPNGFTVHQKITKTHTVAIKTPLGNTIKERGYIQNLVFQRTEDVNMRKHGTAIAPNLVHSLDACHLQETVNNMPMDVSFAMIHDSFGCHAADAEELNAVLREVFVDMYGDGNYLNKFLIQQKIQVDDMPDKGSLDLTLVLEDEFFFS